MENLGVFLTQDEVNLLIKLAYAVQMVASAPMRAEILELVRKIEGKK